MKKSTKMILASCIILGLLFTTKPLYAENVETQDEYQMLMYDYSKKQLRMLQCLIQRLKKDLQV